MSSLWRAAWGLVFLACAAPPKVQSGSPAVLVSIPARASGLSGVAVDEGGASWAVAERDHVLVPLTIAKQDATPGAPVPVTQVPAGLDLEALAFLPDGRVAFGTERHVADRSSDLLLFARRQGDSFVVEESVPFLYAPWSLTVEDNRGIEALCAAGDSLLVGIEQVIDEPGRRVAPLALLDAQTRAVTAYRLVLTSPSGKLSALTCWRDGAGALHAYGIERHYGVSRVLHFTVPSTPGEITPTIVYDLATELQSPPNFEGIARLRGGRLFLISDNSSGGDTFGVFLPEKAL